MPERGGILTCHIENIATLYASYLSFVNNGALFIPSNQIHQLGDEVFIAVTLPSSSERLPMNGKVVWINYKAQVNRPAGFAVQIGTDVVGQKINSEIERLLAGKTDSQQATYTM
ncbi:PilZ domain-containing protein [Psychrobacter sp. CAL346-MNA-CIBAN-0220]|uniref:PilZ domain-containing protein n=1 Tax=Psychrobacter sp. CAL346-MNA-CIBAN-0220 TaxID=3140457 RepID=UPI00331891D8